MTKETFLQIVANVVSEADWVKKALAINDSWLDKIVTNPETGNKVKVRSLPLEQRNRYKPQTSPVTQKENWDLPTKKDKIKKLVEKLYPQHALGSGYMSQW
jgi:hypothetical protein